MLDKLTSADFRPYLDQAFLVEYGGDAPLETTLIEVRDLPQQQGELDNDDAPRRGPFSIVLLSTRVDAYLRQNIYTVRHDDMGTLDIFLVPIGQDKRGTLYEAVFS